MSEQGTATVMLGLNLGASLVPWIAAKVWDASGEPVTLVAVAFVSMTAPFCILLVVAARKYVAKKHERGRGRDVEASLGPALAEAQALQQAQEGRGHR